MMLIWRQAHLLFILSAFAALVSSCADSKQDLQKKMDKRNDAYSDYQDRRAIRQQARQERTDMWYDRAMGKGPKVDTGLRLPTPEGD